MAAARGAEADEDEKRRREARLKAVAKAGT